MEVNNEESIIFEQSDLFSIGFPIMEEIRRQGKLCDVTLKVDDQSFSAHRIVLAATIPYFRAMFTHDMVESKQRDIKIQGIDAAALEALINFAYNGRVVLDTENVQGVMVGASFLQLNQVKDACAHFLKQRFHPNNVLGIRTFADTLGCSALITEADRYIHQYFYEVSMSDEYLSLSCPALFSILQTDELHVFSEEQVFEAVMRWVKRDPDSRKKDLPKLLATVRMPLLTPQYLTDRVAVEELIRTSHECRDLLDEARDYHLMPERRPLLQSFRTQPRCCNYIMGRIFAVGGLTKSGDSLSTVEVYDPIVGRWQLAEAMTMLRSRVGVAVMRNRLYAFGGYNGSERLSTVEVFDPQKRAWSRVSPDKDVWTVVASMIKHRSAGGVVAFEGYIYALGGHDGLSIFDSVTNIQNVALHK